MATSSRGRRSGNVRSGGRGKKQTGGSNLKVGAAWENLNEDGSVKSISILWSDEFDGEINGYRLVLLPNDYKEQQKHPDYNLLRFPEEN